MDYDRFIGLVQHRARLGTREEAVGAIRATLETLADRLTFGEVKDAASQLPREIAYYLSHATRTERLSLDDFYSRVAVREPSDLPQAVFHARVVVSVLQEALSPGELSDIRAQLPTEYDPLFDQQEFLNEDRMADAPERKRS